MEPHQLHHTMQNGNVTNTPSYDDPIFPWSTFAGVTTTETPGFHPMLIPVDATSETDDDVDPNNFINGVGFTTNAPEEPITGTTPTNPTNGMDAIHSVPRTENKPAICRPIPARLTLGSTTFTFRPGPIDNAENHTAMEIPTETAKENIDPNGSHLPLVDLAVQIVPGLVSSYEDLDTYSKLRGQTEFTDEYAGFGLSSIHKDRITRIWRLISDVDLVDAISSVTRSMHNHQCRDLVEIFTNITRLVWTQCIPPGGNLDQLTIDLIKRMITADVERYLDTAIEMKANGHTRPIAQNPTSQHVITFKHRASGVTGPDRHHSETFICEMEQAIGDLFNLITDIKTTLEGVQSNTEWISCGQQLGFRTYTPDQEERNRINSAISDLDLHRTIHPRHERVQKERELNPLPELAPR